MGPPNAEFILLNAEDEQVRVPWLVRKLSVSMLSKSKSKQGEWGCQPDRLENY